jgi:hypothetical protein
MKSLIYSLLPYPIIQAIRRRRDKARSYIRKKHFGRVQPVTVESLESLLGGVR